MDDTQVPEDQRKRVLLADDDPLIIRMYQKKLSTDGYLVDTAFNGEEAIAKVVKQKPDLILLDVMMPKMNGVETLKTLKSKPETADIPIIFLTNLGDNKEDIEKAKQLGAFNYLVKAEVDLKRLSEEVEKTINSQPLQSQTNNQPSQPEQPEQQEQTVTPEVPQEQPSQSQEAQQPQEQSQQPPQQS